MVPPGATVVAVGRPSSIVATITGASGTGAGSGTGALANAFAAGAFLTSPCTEPNCLRGLETGVRIPPGAAIAAIGVIRMANKSRQATNTLTLPGTSAGIEFFTFFDFLATND